MLRTYQYGVVTFGTQQADLYFNSLFNFFEKLQDSRMILNPLIVSKGDINEAFVSVTPFILEWLTTSLKSILLSVEKILILPFKTILKFCSPTFSNKNKNHLRTLTSEYQLYFPILYS